MQTIGRPLNNNTYTPVYNQGKHYPFIVRLVTQSMVPLEMSLTMMK
jgi:hypothetical protein